MIFTRIDQHVQLYFRKFATKPQYSPLSFAAMGCPDFHRRLPAELKQDDMNKLIQSVIQGLKLDLEKSEEYSVSDADWGRLEIKLAVYTSLTHLRSWVTRHSA